MRCWYGWPFDPVDFRHHLHQRGPAQPPLYLRRQGDLCGGLRSVVQQCALSSSGLRRVLPRQSASRSQAGTPRRAISQDGASCSATGRRKRSMAEKPTDVEDGVVEAG